MRKHTDISNADKILISPRTAAALFDYRDVESFIEMCEREGVDGMVRLGRTIRFNRTMLEEWANRRARDSNLAA